MVDTSYVWFRCIDWVLYRQRNGLPVRRLNDEDTCPAAIDTRFNVARDHASDSAHWGLQGGGRLLSMGHMIVDWARTPQFSARMSS
jgi:hypothetical protein